VNEPGRLICIDYGARYLGLAVADYPGVTARALETIDITRRDPIAAIAGLIREEEITRILIGFPFSDIEGDIHRQIHAFRDKIVAAFPGFPVAYADESWSSQEADALLSETGIGRKKKKRSQDSEAAKLVLIRYLREYGDV
jgi:putative holliday junction resolvase